MSEDCNTIEIKATIFPNSIDDLLRIFMNVKLTHIEFYKRKVNFTYLPPLKSSELTVTVKTDEDIDQLELIAFLMMPGIGYKGGAEWLAERFNHYGGRFPLDIDKDDRSKINVGLLSR
jgi:hypothetical protein